MPHTKPYWTRLTYVFSKTLDLIHRPGNYVDVRSPLPELTIALFEVQLRARREAKTAIDVALDAMNLALQESDSGAI